MGTRVQRTIVLYKQSYEARYTDEEGNLMTAAGETKTLKLCAMKNFGAVLFAIYLIAML